MRARDMKELRAWDFAIKFFEVQGKKFMGLDDYEAKLYGAKMALILNLKKNGYVRTKKFNGYIDKNENIKTEKKTRKTNIKEYEKIYEEFMSRGWNNYLESVITRWFDEYSKRLPKSKWYNECKFFVAKSVAENGMISWLHKNYLSWYQRKVNK